MRVWGSEQQIGLSESDGLRRIGRPPILCGKSFKSVQNLGIGRWAVTGNATFICGWENRKLKNKNSKY